MARVFLNRVENDTSFIVNWSKQRIHPVCYQIGRDVNGRQYLRFLTFRESDIDRTNGIKQDMIFVLEELREFLNNLE